MYQSSTSFALTFKARQQVSKILSKTVNINNIWHWKLKVSLRGGVSTIQDAFPSPAFNSWPQANHRQIGQYPSHVPSPAVGETPFPLVPPGLESLASDNLA